MKPPARLYKYRPIDEKAISLVVNSVIYFAKADQFNDPFDCRLRYNYEGTDAEWRAGLTTLLKQHYPDLTSNAIARMVASKIKTGAHRDAFYLLEAEEIARRHQIEATGILCLTANPTNILMWSHYADNHKGCCLEFSTDGHIFKGAEPVEYAVKYPNVRYIECIGKPETHARLTTLTKSKLWKYEQEWRVFTLDGAGVYKYEPASLTGIICGYWMPSETMDLIKNLVKGRSPEVTLYQAIPKEREFEMKLVPLK